MSLLTPKTIVITAYPGKHGSITVPSSRNDEYSLLDAADSFDMDTGGTKKRRRLTHLSPDEKLLRRKLKNRVAAQTARDRKKALMGELEERVAQLEEENKLLRRQNNSLKETSTTLSQENAALKSRLSEGSLTSVKTESSTIRSAAPAVPLQKEQVQVLSRWMVQYVAFVVTLSLMISSACYKNLSETSSPPGSRKRKQQRPSRRVSTEETNNLEEASDPHLEWWGSHQRSWNPSTN